MTHDITHCQGRECPLRNSCRRYLALLLRPTPASLTCHTTQRWSATAIARTITNYKNKEKMEINNYFQGSVDRLELQNCKVYINGTVEHLHTLNCEIYQNKSSNIEKLHQHGTNGKRSRTQIKLSASREIAALRAENINLEKQVEALQKIRRKNRATIEALEKESEKFQNDIAKQDAIAKPTGTKDMEERIDILLSANREQAARIRHLEALIEGNYVNVYQTREYEPNRYDLIKVAKQLKEILGDDCPLFETGRYPWIEMRISMDEYYRRKNK